MLTGIWFLPCAVPGELLFVRIHCEIFAGQIHAGGVERGGEAHGEEGDEAKGSLGFHEIDLIFTPQENWCGKRRGRNGAGKRTRPGRSWLAG